MQIKIQNSALPFAPMIMDKEISISQPSVPYVENNEEHAYFIELLRELTKTPQETADVQYSLIPILAVIVFRAGTMYYMKTRKLSHNRMGSL